MSDRQLRKFVAGFRRGILAGQPSAFMCFAVCAPLQTLLSLAGVHTELTEANFLDINHVWLTLPDGRIIDPTADQFGLEPVYIGPLPLLYATRQIRLASVMYEALA